LKPVNRLSEVAHDDERTGQCSTQLLDEFVLDASGVLELVDGNVSSRRQPTRYRMSRTFESVSDSSLKNAVEIDSLFRVDYFLGLLSEQTSRECVYCRYLSVVRVAELFQSLVKCGARQIGM
jgi:hypothetical protein